MDARVSTGGNVPTNGGPPDKRANGRLANYAEDLDSNRLAREIATGDTGAFATLYDRYYQRVYAYLFSRLKHHHDTEEATQHVFTRALEAVAQFDPRRRGFRVWLFAIAHNHAIDLRRRQVCDVIDPTCLADERDRMEMHFEDQSDDAGSDPRLAQLIERLSDRQRHVLVLRYVGNLTPSDIAHLLDMSPDAVRHVEQRALVFLRTRMTAA